MKNKGLSAEYQQLFTELLEPEYKRANIFCRKLIGDSEAGDDLFQEALVTAFRRFESLRDQNAFRPWLYRIIVNRFHSQTRLPWSKKILPLTQEAELTLPGDDPTGRYTARRLLTRAMAVLSPQLRAMITLHELEGWPIEELATMYGRSEGAIKAALFRARRKMRNRLMQTDLGE